MDRRVVFDESESAPTGSKSILPENTLPSCFLSLTPIHRHQSTNQSSVQSSIRMKIEIEIIPPSQPKDTRDMSKSLDQIWTEQREVKRQNEAILADQNLSEQTRVAREQCLKEALQAYLNTPSRDYKKLGLPDYQALLDRTWVRELVDKRLETMTHSKPDSRYYRHKYELLNIEGNWFIEKIYCEVYIDKEWKREDIGMHSWNLRPVTGVGLSNRSISLVLNTCQYYLDNMLKSPYAQVFQKSIIDYFAILDRPSYRTMTEQKGRLDDKPKKMEVGLGSVGEGILLLDPHLCRLGPMFYCGLDIHLLDTLCMLEQPAFGELMQTRPQVVTSEAFSDCTSMVAQLKEEMDALKSQSEATQLRCEQLEKELKDLKSTTPHVDKWSLNY